MAIFDIPINLKVKAQTEASAEQQVFDFFKEAYHAESMSFHNINEWEFFEFIPHEDTTSN